MRYREIKPQIINESDLFEIDMSPSNLEKLVGNIDARVGMEFEMIIPDVDINDSDSPEYEQDFSNNPEIGSIEEILNFFDDRDYNSSIDLRNLERDLRSDLQDFIDDTFDSRWQADKKSFVYDYVKDNISVEEAARILGLDPDSLDGLTRSQRETIVDVITDEMNDLEGLLSEIRNEALADFASDPDTEEEWLVSANLQTMADVHSNYNIAWPHYNLVEPDNTGINAVADSFSKAIGRPVNVSTSYHGARREANTYVVEPDGSLKPDYSSDAGLEFVSPPLTVPEMIEDLAKVLSWAKSVGAYTNKSTGLHMNVSIVGYSDNDLDYVKLALLLGDKHVLDQFDRLKVEPNRVNYAVSALDKVSDRAKSLTLDQVQGLFDQMRAGLNQLASRSLHGTSVAKYTSIHPRNKYVEFRSPGGDWLNQDIPTLISTMLRFVVVLDAAVQPDKFRNEYLSKLRKLLVPKSETDPIDYFAKYVAGEIPKQALKSFLRQTQLQRKATRGKAEKMWWIVGLKSNPNYSIEVVGMTRDEAVDNAMRADPELMRFNFENDFTADPLRPFVDDKTQSRQGSIRYEIINVQRNQVINTFNASSDEAALQRFDSMFSGANRNLYDVRRARNQQADTDDSSWIDPPNPSIMAPETQPDANFAFVDRINNQVVQWLTRNTRREAEQELQGTGLAHLYRVVDVQPRQSSQPTEYIIRNVDRDYDAGFIEAYSLESAVRQFRNYIGQSSTNYALLDNNRGVVITSADLRSPESNSTFEPNYEIVDRRTMRRLFVMRAADEREAREKFDDWLMANGLPADTEDYGWRRIGQAIPGSTQDIQQRRAAAAQGQGQFTGQWRILIDGEEVHRFGGVGNVQADANRQATRWLLAQQREGRITVGVSSEIEVVPVMS